MAPMKPKPRKPDAAFRGTLSLEQLGRRWRMSRKEIRHLLGRGQLDFVQVRGVFRVPLEEIDRFERGQAEGS